MKHRSVNIVREVKIRKKLRQKRSESYVTIKANLDSVIYNAPNQNVASPNWNSKVNGTYVKKIHGKLG